MREDDKDSWLVILGGLPFIGDWVSTIVGLLPAILLVFLFDMEGTSNYGVMWWVILSGIALIPWLMFLERRQGVRINIPYLPIKWLWLTPVLIVIGLWGLASEYFGWA